MSKHNMNVTGFFTQSEVLSCTFSIGFMTGASSVPFFWVLAVICGIMAVVMVVVFFSNRTKSKDLAKKIENMEK